MTAYRTSEPPPDSPYVIPDLERALLDCQRRQRWLDVIPFAILVSVTVLLVLFVLEYDFGRETKRAPLLGVFAGPCAFGSAIMGFGLVRKRPQPLLERLRTGIPIRRVHRDDAPALHVEFADGSGVTLSSVRRRHLARVEQLLHLQMATGSAPPGVRPIAVGVRPPGESR